MSPLQRIRQDLGERPVRIALLLLLVATVAIPLFALRGSGPEEEPAAATGSPVARDDAPLAAAAAALGSASSPSGAASVPGGPARDPFAPPSGAPPRRDAADADSGGSSPAAPRAQAPAPAAQDAAAQAPAVAAARPTPAATPVAPPAAPAPAPDPERDRTGGAPQDEDGSSERPAAAPRPAARPVERAAPVPATHRLVHVDLRLDGATVRDVVRLRPFPGARLPIALYLGTTARGRAAFALADGVRAGGDGFCKPSGRLCTHLLLAPGDRATVALGARRHALRVTRIVTEETTSAARAAAFAARESRAGRCLLDARAYLAVDADADDGTLQPREAETDCRYVRDPQTGTVGVR